MLRITELIKSSKNGIFRKPFPGVILIWNLTNTCNLKCKHCYASATQNRKEELSREEILGLLADLQKNRVRFAVLSGGEPLLREDLFEIACSMKEVGIIPSLSTNGGLIEDRHLPLIQEHFDYVGISIDGPELIHDRFRGKSGAFKKSLGAIRKCRDSGLKVGIRFTICKETFSGLSFVFELAEKEGIPKIYLSHLVDSGRADTVEDLAMDDYKEGVQFIIKKAFSYVENGIGIDVVTGNNEADGVVLYREFQKRFPAQEDVLYKNLQTWGGNQAGVRLVNIDYLGNVKPDPFFPDSLGNLREKTFSEIWEDAALLGPLRNRPRILEGKCGSCTYLNICNGGSRARAFSRYGSYSAEDPACHVMSQ